MANISSESALVQEILKDAEKKAKKVIRNALKEAKKLKKRALDEIEQKKQHTKENALRRASKETEKIISGIELELKRRELRMQEKVLDEIFIATEQKLQSLTNTSEYPKILKKLILAAAKELPSNNLLIQLREEDKKLIDKNFLMELTEAMSQEDRKIIFQVDNLSVLINGGAILLTSDKRICFDNSFAARLYRQRRSLRQQIAKILF